ncbi:MAG: 16S rRNA (cytidine(1402)-2'-O)-methyltransferase [Nitrospinae bacterium]|nr:16S rRNA (cytidine(1402)-2'-O)-methyltransferase [Nitrospinota bacterium]
MHKNREKGTLYIVSTPIGNMEDITLRAIRVLKEVDIIAAEDNRRTRKLLTHYNISTPTTSYHDYNKKRKGKELIEKLKEGGNIALVSDAGTPGISDPAYHLIQLSLKEGIDIVPIPGATAIISALTISGLPTDRFVFEGFLPRKKGLKKRKLEEIAEEERTIVLYESPHRIAHTLSEMSLIMGKRRIVIAREMTKMYEEIMRGDCESLVKDVREREWKGEITMVIEGKRP